MYGITPEEYHHQDMPMRRFVDDIDDDHENDKKVVAEFRKGSILSAAKNVVIGFHDITRTCWECKSVCQDLKICAKCSAAQDCSRECKRSAWNKGHRHQRKLLECKNTALNDSLKVMDEYYSLGNENSFVENGLSLSVKIDIGALEVAFIVGLPLGKEDQIKWGIPSMSQYYANLERVALGEDWFFPNASDAHYREVRLGEEGEFDYFIALCNFLCFDYGMIMNGIVQKACALMFGGVEMPATIFMEIYRRGRKVEDPADRFRLRREHMRKFLQCFMEKFHT